MLPEGFLLTMQANRLRQDSGYEDLDDDTGIDNLDRRSSTRTAEEREQETSSSVKILPAPAEAITSTQHREEGIDDAFLGFSFKRYPLTNIGDPQGTAEVKQANIQSEISDQRAAIQAEVDATLEAMKDIAKIDGREERLATLQYRTGTFPPCHMLRCIMHYSFEHE